MARREKTERPPRREDAAPELPPFRPGFDYLGAVAASWLIPGAGHWILGHRVQAALLASVLLGTFWWGEVMAGGYAVTRKEHPVFFYGQIGNGLSTLVADRLQWADVEPDPDAPKVAAGSKAIDRKPPPGLATGILFTCISGLLNTVLVLHVMDPRSWEASPPLGGKGAGRRAGGPGGGGGEPGRRGT